MQPPGKTLASRREAVLDALFSTLEPRQQIWAILDGARDDRVYSTFDMFSADKCCLYAGELEPEIKTVAPYLVQIDREDRWTRYLIDKGWGESWGVFLRASASLSELRRHLRRFLIVLDDRGRRRIFRYYDPRVLRGYLPTCLTGELRFVFGPIDEYLIESEDASRVLRFSFDGVNLLERAHPVGE